MEHISNRNHAPSAKEEAQRKPAQSTNKRAAHQINQHTRRSLLHMFAASPLVAYKSLSIRTGYSPTVLKEVCEQEAINHRFDDRHQFGNRRIA